MAPARTTCDMRSRRSSSTKGEKLRTVIELLGHSTIRLTADTYGHVLRKRAQDAAEAIDMRVRRLSDPASRIASRSCRASRGDASHR
jgi:hypothetical protein